MEFISSCLDKRPIRLKEATRKFAYESVYDHKYGKMAAATPSLSLDDVADFDKLTTYEKYALAEKRIALESPIRIFDGELICGSAPFNDSIHSFIPARRNGEWIFWGFNHLTPAFFNVVKYGTDWYRERVNASMKTKSGEELEFLQMLSNTIDCIEIWHGRYIDALLERAKNEPEYLENVKYLKNVPMKPATNFREGVQSLWFIFAYSRMMASWPAIGRIDVMLGDLLKNDLASGAITIDEAREILAHFFIKGTEWAGAHSPDGSGDAQHYQNIVLSGLDEDGNDITNEVTYLVLEIIEELGISDFPIAVRIGPSSPDRLLRKMAEAARFGGGVIAAYNDPLIVKALIDYGYPEKEARVYANDGCWEVQIPGHTMFSYKNTDALQVLQKNVMGIDQDSDTIYSSYDELFAKFAHELKLETEKNMCGCFSRRFDNYDSDAERYSVWHNYNNPTGIISLLEEGCIESAKDYTMGGSKYIVESAHIGGAPDAANSLYALKKLVFDEKKFTYSEYLAALKSDFEGREDIRRAALSLDYFGNDNDECDVILGDVLKEFRKISDSCCRFSECKVPAGVSTFGRQIEWAPLRTASPHGRKAHDVLASNVSPTPGTDKLGATAVIRSCSKINLDLMTCGAALDLKLMPSSASGEDGIDAIEGLYRGFIACGGFFMQIDVIDDSILRRAQEHPEEYPALAVRVSGWSARFVTLNRDWQDMIIARTTQASAR